MTFIKQYWPVLIAGLLLLGVGGVAVHQMTRGIRNNNPGNIRRGQRWQGLAPQQTDADFDQFVSPYWGIRALAKTLKTYQVKHKLNTIAGIITRWAPPSENITLSYVDSVAKRLGVAPNAPVDLNNTNTLAALTNAIIKHENGVNPYTAEEVLSAVKGA